MDFDAMTEGMAVDYANALNQRNFEIHWPNSEVVSELTAIRTRDLQMKQEFEKNQFVHDAGVVFMPRGGPNQNIKLPARLDLEFQRNRREELRQRIRSRQQAQVNDAQTNEDICELTTIESKEVENACFVINALQRFDQNLMVRTITRCVDDTLPLHFLQAIIDKIAFTDSELADQNIFRQVLDLTSRLVQKIQVDSNNTIGYVTDPTTRLRLRISAANIWSNKAAQLLEQLLRLSTLRSKNRTLIVQLMDRLDEARLLSDYNASVDTHVVRVHPEFAVESPFFGSTLAAVGSVMYVEPRGKQQPYVYSKLRDIRFSFTNGIVGPYVPRFICEWEKAAHVVENNLIDLTCTGSTLPDAVREYDRPKLYLRLGRDYITSNRYHRSEIAINSFLVNQVPNIIAPMTDMLKNSYLFPSVVERKPKYTSYQEHTYEPPIIESNEFKVVHDPAVDELKQYLDVVVAFCVTYVSGTVPDASIRDVDFDTVSKRLSFMASALNGGVVSYALSCLGDNILSTNIAPTPYTTYMKGICMKLIDAVNANRRVLGETLATVGYDDNLNTQGRL